MLEGVKVIIHCVFLVLSSYLLYVFICFEMYSPLVYVVVERAIQINET